MKGKPAIKPVARQVAKPVTTVRTPVTTVRPVAAPTAPARATKAKTTPTHRKTPAKHKHDARAPTHRSVLHAPALPRLTPARLIAPATNADAGRARKLAAGALSLLLLALASATLLAFTARVDRRRVVR